MEGKGEVYNEVLNKEVEDNEELDKKEEDNGLV